MRKKPDVSVCVLTYQPQEDKLFKTLNSILKQKNLDIQIIVSDDGSMDNKFPQIKEYLDNAGVTDYKLVSSSENHGTVKNTEQALLLADGKYAKLISPGDCLYKERRLSEWKAFLDSSGKLWSFCDAQYYIVDDQGRCVMTPHSAFPQDVQSYIQHKDSSCQWNYVMLDDIVLGAATLCERDLMLQYIQEIAGKVKYGEDNIYRLMMFDGYIPAYFSLEVILYENGTGISTSGNEVWAKRLQDDWKETVNIILSRPAIDGVQRKIQKTLKYRNKFGMILGKYGRYLEKGYVCLALQKRCHRRTSGNKGEY